MAADVVVLRWWIEGLWQRENWREVKMSTMSVAMWGQERKKMRGKRRKRRRWEAWKRIGSVTVWAAYGSLFLSAF
jgi:hypothetical protein